MVTSVAHVCPSRTPNPMPLDSLCDDFVFLNFRLQAERRCFWELRHVLTHRL